MNRRRRQTSSKRANVVQMQPQQLQPQQLQPQQLPPQPPTYEMRRHVYDEIPELYNNQANGMYLHPNDVSGPETFKPYQKLDKNLAEKNVYMYLANKP